MARKKKHLVVCDECTHTCEISHKEKAPLQHCPFCGEAITIETEERPLLNDFDSLDEFDEEEYYEDDEEIEED